MPNCRISWLVEETNAAGATLAVEASRLKELIAGFKLDGSQAAVRAIDRATKPIASPARALGQKLAGAFGGRTAVATAAKEWEEF